MIPDDEVEVAPADIPDDEVSVVEAPPDQGPPLSAANPPEEFHPSPLQSAAVGWSAGLPGAHSASAAIRSGIDSFSTKRKLLDDYQMQRERIKKLDAAASEENPKAYYSANIPANVATVIAAGELIPAKIAAYFAAGKVMPHVGRILGNTALSAAQEADQGTLDAEHVTRDVGAAEALNLMLHGAAKPFKGIAKGAQIPQKVANAFYGWLGRSKTAPGKTAIEGEDLASRLARAAQRGEADLPEGGGFSVSPKEFGDDISGVAVMARDRALRKHGAEKWANKETPLLAMEGTAQELRDDAVTLRNKAEEQAAKAERMRRAETESLGKTAPAGKPSAPPDKRNRDIFDEMMIEPNKSTRPMGDKTAAIIKAHRGGASSPDPETGPLIRNPATAAESKKRFGDADKPEGWDSRYKKNPSGDEQGDEMLRVTRRRNPPEYDSSVTRKSAKNAERSRDLHGSEQKQAQAKVNDEEAAKLDALASMIKPEATANRKSSIADITGRAREKLNTANEADKVAETSAKASAIIRGRNKVVRGAGDALNVGSLGALSGATRAVRSAAKGIDKVGDLGARLEKVKSWAEKLAAKDTPTGRTVKRYLEKDYDGFITRMATLVDPAEDVLHPKD